MGAAYGMGWALVGGGGVRSTRGDVFLVVAYLRISSTYPQVERIPPRLVRCFPSAEESEREPTHERTCQQHSRLGLVFRHVPICVATGMSVVV